MHFTIMKCVNLDGLLVSLLVNQEVVEETCIQVLRSTSVDL